MHYPACFRQAEDDSYYVFFPDLPDVVARGRTFEEAMENAAIALRNGLQRRRSIHQQPSLPSLVFFISPDET